ncbi:MAG: metallophosphoesterase [Candidatus Syntropharchaeia archaeon]
MKKVFISDLHIGDGSAKDDFVYDDELVEFLNSMCEEDDIELVIVGDGFELLESKAVKEWGLIPFDTLLEKLDGYIFEDITQKHEKVFSALKRFTKKHKLVYIVGNHDYYLLKNLKLQEKLKEKIGDISIVPYYFDKRFKILAIHGNQFDVINKFVKDKRSGRLIPPLGDFMTRYMMVRFDDNIQSLVPKEIIRDYDNVRPAMDVFHWFEYVMEAYDIGVDVLELWIKSFVEMLRTTEVKLWMKKNFPKTHWLSKVFVNRFGGMKLGEILVRVTMKLREFRKTDYLYKNAKRILKGKSLKEADFAGYIDGEKPDIPETDIVIFGHIHHHSLRIVPVGEKKKVYINCGTWRPVLEKVNGKKRYGFQRKADLFYAVIAPSRDGVEITTKVTSKLEDITIPK